jgi:hypothetical protein
MPTNGFSVVFNSDCARTYPFFLHLCTVTAAQNVPIARRVYAREYLDMTVSKSGAEITLASATESRPLKIFGR